jgi:hypothetical protein
MNTIKQLLVDPSGLLVVLRPDGTVVRQYRVDHKSVAWMEVPVDGLDGARLTQLAVDHERTLHGVDQAGHLWAQYRPNPSQRPRETAWQRIPGPDDAILDWATDEAISSEQSAAMIRRQLTLMKEKLR